MDLNWQRSFVGFVQSDGFEPASEAALHFFERGYRQFAAYSLDTERFFVERVRNFVQALEAYGYRCLELPEGSSDNVVDWEKSQARLMKWLCTLPKPIGIFAANDQLGVRLLEACQRAGISVPEEVAVVGAENEETLCSFATPLLTSVRFNGHAIGYAAAELLDQMMRGGRAETREILFPPKGIKVRGSSDEWMITDAIVARAARFIRENAMLGINVDDVCRKLNVSRSTLDRRMKAALKRKPKEQILRVRFREVERLLCDTDLTVDAIAEQTGFSHSHYLQAAFKDVYGQTPRAFRRARSLGETPV